MRILVLYATTDGQTRKIARHVMAVLSGIGQGVELMNVTEAGPDAGGGWTSRAMTGRCWPGRCTRAAIRPRWSISRGPMRRR